MDYWRHVESYYVKNGEPTSEPSNIKQALRPVRQLYGHTLAAEFGPLSLKACRQWMVDAGLSRTNINKLVCRIRQLFKWAAGNELLPGQVYHDLQTVVGLLRGGTEAREAEPVRPVSDAFVDAICGHVLRQVWGMVRLARLTGMRPGEVCLLRACDMDTSGRMWAYRPASHKNEHHGKSRGVYLGPRAQAVVSEFLKTDLEAYLFSPADAEAERRAEQRQKRKTPVQPSQRERRRRNPKRTAGERYTTVSLRRAVKRGIAKANRQRKQQGELEIPNWHPNQLRHSAGTEARKQGGLEAAQVILGHSKADVTQIYAEQDREQAIHYMAQHD